MAAAGDDGHALFRTVFEYASLGEHHRAGTPEDAATLDWFEDKLREIGAETERQAWTFDRYEAEWSLSTAGEEIEAIPLFYEGVGEVDTDASFIATLAPGAGGLDAFRKQSAEARAAGAKAAIAIVSQGGGRLFAINRRPGPAGGLPTLLAGAGAAPKLEAGPVRLTMSARIVPGQSANVIGRIGPGPDANRLLLTTPLSGWFRCAGERGTGIAIMLAAAKTLADERCSLLITGNSGHELEDFGAHRFLETGPECRSVFHFGASVAAGEPGYRGLELTSGMRIRAWVPGRERLLRRIFRAIRRTPEFVPNEAHSDPSAWLGEARAWCALGRPMLSIAGNFPLFHTPADLPARATSPELLAASYRACLEASRVLSRA